MLRRGQENSSTHSIISTRWGQYTRGQSPRSELNRRLGWSRSRYGCFVGGKITPPGNGTTSPRTPSVYPSHCKGRPEPASNIYSYYSQSKVFYAEHFVHITALPRRARPKEVIKLFVMEKNPGGVCWIFRSPECPYRLWNPPSLLLNGYREPDHSHLVPWLRMSGFIPPHPYKR
jgi:hypothetical protein